MENNNEQEKKKPSRPRPRRRAPRRPRAKAAPPQPVQPPEQQETPAPAAADTSPAAAADTPAATPKGPIKSAINKLFKAMGGKEQQPAPGATTEEQLPEAATTAEPARESATPVSSSSKTNKGTTARKQTPRRTRQTPKKSAADNSESTTSKAKRNPKTASKLLINAEEPEECRIVLLENGKVEAFHVQTIVRTKTKGNIYKGRVTSVEPSLQAAFVDIGLEKNAFLPFGDIHPEYYVGDHPAGTHWKDLESNQILHRGQEVLVEVVKEAAGTKGANVTTFLSLPGRFLVLMPGSDSHGISRKLDDKTRSALRKMIEDFKLPEGIGYIIRTASKNVTKTALSKDLRYLLNLWKTIKNQGQKKAAPALIYKEQDIVARYLRDHFSTEVTEIVVDTEEALEQVNTFLKLQPARQNKATARLHMGSKPLFNQFRIEEQIEQIYQPKVKLASGGSIVINPTEALVAIDVNSGSTSKDKNFEESIFLANMEAAEELARQLRLRDLGGLIVVDFIDMRSSKHIREVEKKVRESMKRDKAKVDISRISKFGLMQISRQRLGPPVLSEGHRVCEHCQGRGVVQTVETQVVSLLRKIQTGVVRKNVSRALCTFPMEIAHYFLNKKRGELAELEEKYGVEIIITADPNRHAAQADIVFQR